MASRNVNKTERERRIAIEYIPSARFERYFDTIFPFEQKRETIWPKWSLDSDKSKANHNSRRRNPNKMGIKNVISKMKTSKEPAKVNSRTIHTANISYEFGFFLLFFHQLVQSESMPVNSE